MATTMRGGGVGKEKRITSPSSSTVKRSPKPSSSSPSTTKNSSISERKSIPNHSRPTLNSKNDPSKTPKKSAQDKPASKPALSPLPSSQVQPAVDRKRSLDRPSPSSQVQPAVDRRRTLDRPSPSSQVQPAVDRRRTLDRPSPSSQVQPAVDRRRTLDRPSPSSQVQPAVDRRRTLDRPSPSSQVQSTLDRRRSFDRPPPSLQVQKAVQNGATTHNVQTLRSSYFSSRTSTTPLASSSSRRPTTSTSVSSRKVSVKGAPLVSKPGALRRSASANNTMMDSTKGRASIKKGLESIPQEGASVDYETRSDSHIMNEEHVLVNIDSELESLPEISDMSETADDLGDPTNIELEAHQPVEQDHRDIDTEDERQQEDNKLVVDDQEDPTTVKHPDEDIQGIVEETPDNQKQIDSENQDNAGEPEHEESNAEPAKTSMEDKAIEEAEVNREEETKTSSTIVTPLLRSHPSLKKENQAYNDVIEETATKLRMKTNKVLALAGAFETVISLQDTNKKH